MTNTTEQDRDPIFKARIAGHDYLIDRLNLRDLRTLKQRFGMTQLEDFNPTDPDQLTGLLYLSLRREGNGDELALAKAEQIDLMEIMEWLQGAADDALADEQDESPGPTPAAGGGSGKKATPPKKPGSPS